MKERVGKAYAQAGQLLASADAFAAAIPVRRRALSCPHHRRLARRTVHERQAPLRKPGLKGDNDRTVCPISGHSVN